MGVLDVDAELLERQHRLATEIGAGIQRGEVEVAALVEDLGRLAVAEVEVLQLSEDVREPEANEADTPLIDERLDVVGGHGLVGHGVLRPCSACSEAATLASRGGGASTRWSGFVGGLVEPVPRPVAQLVER